MDSDPARESRFTADRLRSAALSWLGALLAVVLFLVSVRLLGTTTDALAPRLETVVRRVVTGDASALGVSWMAAYLLANGSVVAALVLSLFGAGLLTPTQLFVMVAGSRLGASAVIVVIGAADYVQRREYSLGEATSLGLLAFVLTHSVYLPATTIGYLVLSAVDPSTTGVRSLPAIELRSLSAVDAVASALTGAVGLPAAFVVAVAALVVSLTLLDRVLSAVDTDSVRSRVAPLLRRRWASFGLGLVVTALSTSVAVSVGVVVPLYNRGYVRREEIVPYVLAANVGTLVDTLLVAAVLGLPVGVTVVTFLVVTATVVTLLTLAVYEPYVAFVGRLHDGLVDDRRLYVAFLALLVAVPTGLVLVSRL